VKIDFGFSTLRGTPFDESQLRAQMSYSNSETDLCSLTAALSYHVSFDYSVIQFTKNYHR